MASGDDELALFKPFGRPPEPFDPADIADPEADTKPAATERVELRLTLAVRASWEVAAKREGLTLSEWLRAAAELAIARGSTR